MSLNKKQARLRRSSRFKARNKEQGIVRLAVYRTPNHIYAQILQYEGSQCRVITSASTIDKKLKAKVSGNKTDKAKIIGKEIATRAKALGIEKVAFDRAGYKYHGRIKALAEAARESGLVF